MALNDTLKTRILLRNDTLTNWTSSTLVLGKGEIAIATGLDGNLAEVRVGNGTTTWSGAAKLAVDASQISGLVEAITPTIEGVAKKYQIVSDGNNAWKLQEAALSGGEWRDVEGSNWSVDFTSINETLTGLTEQLAATNATLNTVSSDYLTSTDKNELTNSIDAKLAKVDFAKLSNDIGLSAASASNKVATQSDIAALDKVMHFKGVVNAVPTDTTDYNVGDVVLVTGSLDEADNGKEFVLVEVDGTKQWEQIGDQAHYATKNYVDTGDSNTLTASKAYTDEKIAGINNTISTDYATKTLASQMSAYALEQANDYTDSKFDGLRNYYTKDEVDAISSDLSSDYSEKIKAVDNKLTAYALSADVTSGIAAAKSEVVGQASELSSASTVNGAKAYAKNYTDEAIAGLSVDNFIKHGEVVQSDLRGFFILDCGNSGLRQDEPTA